MQDAELEGLRRGIYWRDLANGEMLDNNPD
jgi:hypothetical protein